MVRHATREDLPRIYEIYENARAYMKRTGNPTQWGDTEPPIAWLDVDIERKELYVCCDGDDVYGVFMFMMRDEPFYHHPIEGEWLNDEPYAAVHRVASRGEVKGLTLQILNWALEQHPNIRIDTHDDNIPMQRALASAGFTPCGRIWVEDGTPRIAYHKIRH